MLAATRRPPALAERFLTPPGFVWGGFATSDGAVLRIVDDTVYVGEDSGQCGD